MRAPILLQVSYSCQIRATAIQQSNFFEKEEIIAAIIAIFESKILTSTNVL